MKSELEALRERYRKARSEKELKEIGQKIDQLSAADPEAFGRGMIALAKETADRAEGLALRVQLQEVLPAVSMSYVAKHYFGKTRQWLYQRLNGTMVNGKPARMTPEELRTFETALHDLGGKLSSVHVCS